ncbi:MAG: HAD family hydrolase [Pseudomonadota bacterium]
MAQIEAVLFDKDGTLFDFAGTWRQVTIEIIETLAPDRAAAEEMARRGGFDLQSGTFLPGSLIVAGSADELGALWSPLRPDLGAEGLAAEVERMSLEASANPNLLAPAVPDLGALLAGLSARGLALGVATNDSVAGAERQLSSAGVRDAFGFVAGYDSVERPKPAPDMVLAFAEANGLAPSALAMVGDSTHDLSAARAAGVGLAIGVLTGPARETDLAPYADHILPTIGGLPALFDRLIPV